MVKNEVINDFKYASYLAIFLYNLGFITYNLARKKNLISDGFIKTVMGEHSYGDIFMKIPKKIFNLILS